MEYLYNSSQPLEKYYNLDCLIANQTLLTIYKQQLRQNSGRNLNLTDYLLELDKDYMRLETASDNYKFGIWVNLNLYHFLLVSEQQTILVRFENKLELLEYIERRWLIMGYLFIDLKTKVIDKYVLRNMIQELDMRLQININANEWTCDNNFNYYSGKIVNSSI